MPYRQKPTGGGALLKRCSASTSGQTNYSAPGYIGTKMVLAIPSEVLESKIIPQIPMGRLGKPEEVAGLVAYLASDEA